MKPGQQRNNNNNNSNERVCPQECQAPSKGVGLYLSGPQPFNVKGQIFSHASFRAPTNKKM